MSSEITRKNVDRVLAFLLILCTKQANLYNIQTQSSTLNPYCYSKEFEKFIKALYEKNFVISFDWITWQNEVNNRNERNWHIYLLLSIFKGRSSRVQIFWTVECVTLDNLDHEKI